MTPTVLPHQHPHPAEHHSDHHQDHEQRPGTASHGESYPHVRGGPPVLDIGGTVGALLVTMNPDATGTELHLRSEHCPPIRIHTGVWQRTNGENTTTTAVFAALVEGTYWVLDNTGGDLEQITIQGGQLGRIDLRN